MKSKHIIIAFISVGICTSFVYMFNDGDSVKAYNSEVSKERKDKDEFMQNANESPFQSNKETFTGLKYFPPDLKYRIQADLDYVSKREVVTILSNDGNAQSYLSYARAEFDLDNLHNTLLILQIMDGEEKGNLFLAFTDQTSANETYGGGRYLDVKKIPGANSITLDFNKAYNPYCAYSENFSCPFPPKENNLKVALKAGEKSYH